MLQMFVFPQIDDNESKNATSNVLQQTEALLHLSFQVHHALNAIRSPNQWTETSGQITWPPNSPDLKATDVFMRTCEKYSLHPENHNLKEKHRSCSEYHSEHPLPYMDYLDVCRATNTAHIETFEGMLINFESFSTFHKTNYSFV